MSKKRNRKIQIRKRIKETTGKLTFVDVVYMERKMGADGVVELYSTCTCDTWRSSLEAKTITAIAKEAKQHVLESGHAFRKHDSDPE